MRQPSFLLAVPFLILLNCNKATTFTFPVEVDTRTKEITNQEKRTWLFDTLGLIVDNQFDGARLSHLEWTNDSLLTARIDPENEPINASPWYAMRLRSERDQTVTLRLTYPAGVHHRYFPRISEDRQNWLPVSRNALRLSPGQYYAEVDLQLRAGVIHYLAGQEVINSADVGEWLSGLANRHPAISRFSAGTSQLGRDMPAFSISQGALDERPTIVLFSRQHPPEVTGFLCFQAFLDGVLEHPQLTDFLARYQLLVYPLLNPDGVDLGHWRHTAGGVDSNRDWARYEQPEVKQVANGIVKLMKESGSTVVLGLDFHSTYKDVYYTHNDQVVPPTILPGFKDAWLATIGRTIGGDYRINEEAEPIGKPTTMSWFRTQFGAEGITYEIGDGTERAFVARKGKVSAEAMMEVLLRR